MFDENKILSAYSDETERFEAHHIIPLGTVKKVGNLRKNFVMMKKISATRL